MPLMKNGEIFVLKMSSCKISTLAESFLELYGYPAGQYEVIGMREGEKFHEELLFESEAGSLLENDQYFLQLVSRHLFDHDEGRQLLDTMFCVVDGQVYYVTFLHNLGD